MYTDEVMKIVVNEMEKRGANDDEIAKMEICIQYIGNEAFRKYINDWVFKKTYNKGGN